MASPGEHLLRIANRLRTLGRRPRREGPTVAFDRDFYQLQRGLPFDSSRDAFNDFIEHGANAKLSPHPALPFPAIPRRARREWSRGHSGPLRRYLAARVEDMPRLDEEQYRRIRDTAASCAQHRECGDLPVRTDWGSPPTGEVVSASIIVPTFNEFRMTVACVESVLEHTHRDDYEVIVVDNGSKAHIAHALAAFLPSDERVHLLRSPKNLDFAGGTNMGALAASGGRLVLLNNDTKVQDEWLDPLLAPLDDPHVLGTQSLLLYPDGTIQTAGTVFIGDGLLPCHLLAGQPASARLTGVEEWHFTAVTAACMAVRSHDFYGVSGFDTAYRNGFEDVDLCLRLLETAPAGSDFHLASRSRVTHLESKSDGRFNHVDRNRERFVSRWGSRLGSADRGVFRLTDYELVEVSSDELALPAAKPTLRRRSGGADPPRGAPAV